MPRKDPQARREYKEQNRDRDNAKRNARRAANPEYYRSKERDRYKKDPTRQRLDALAYAAAHPEQRRESNAAWRLDNVEYLQEYRRSYYQEHRPELLEQVRLYRLGHPEEIRARNAAQRAQKRGAPINDFSHLQWLELQELQHHRCHYCRKRCKGKLTQDHVQPLSQGGSHTFRNIVGVCQSCNSRKSAGPPPVTVQPLLFTLAPAKKKKAS